MLGRKSPFSLAPNCYIRHVYIDTWRPALFSMINTAAQQFAEIIYEEYRSSPSIGEYRIFTGSDRGAWLLGIATEVPCSLTSAITVSGRIIEKHHCRDNIAMIIAHEIGKMPVTFSSRHFIDGV